MLQKPLIKLRDLKELQCSQKQKAENDEFITPFKVKKPRQPRTTATKTRKSAAAVVGEQQLAATTADPVVVAVPSTPKTTAKRAAKSARKEPPPSQLRINSFFKTCEKSYKIEPLKEELPSTICKQAATEVKAKNKRVPTATKNSASPPKRSRRMGRKRLFVDENSESDYEAPPTNNKNSKDSDWKPSVVQSKPTTTECITIISDSDEEEFAKKKLRKIKDVVKNKAVQHKSSVSEIETPNVRTTRASKSISPQKDIDTPSNKTSLTKESTHHTNVSKSSVTRVSPTTTPTSLPTPENGDSDAFKPAQNSDTPHASSSGVNSKTSATTKRKPKPCPPYKIVEGTTFAVDAFQYGCIANVNHYFLTHFHADHYIGLTRKFAMPLYMSSITARLVRTFIPIDEQYIHELELHSPIFVDNVEITALDANHCPGAIMLLFKFPATGKCILHTGDFRAWHGMESEPVFWNNDIHTIYLDTTYISNKNPFCTQYESIDKAKDLINKFREKHSHNRILYVCGSYVIGKEKFWSAIAQEYELKVWSEDNRSKALKSIDDKDLNRLLVQDPRNADMHVIAMAKLSYFALVEYFALYEHAYDMVLAIRPSGWEKDSKPQYRGKINIIGIEYSEHSSYSEMQRFVKFLKPQKVISTVPSGRDLMKTAVVPEKWYKYQSLHGSSNYQPCIEQFMGTTPNKKKPTIRLPNERKGGLETFVSPLKNKTPNRLQEINNNCDKESIVSLKSSEPSVPGHTNPFAVQANSNDLHEIQNNVNITKEDKGNLIKNNKTRTSNSQRAKRHVKNEPKTPDTKAELILSQTLNDGESCSIFIPTTTELQSVCRANSSDFFESPRISKKNGHCMDKVCTEVIQSKSITNSSEYFETTTSKNRKRRANESSMSGEEIPVSQKRNTRLTSKHSKSHSVASTMDEDELEFQIQLLKQSETTTPTPKPTKGRQSNPLLKSTTTSYSSSINEDVAAASESCRDLENALIWEQIPASQTTNDLANTPRPLRNRIKNACSQILSSQNEQISASQTTNDLANTPRPLRNKMKLAYLWQTTTAERDDVIPASQTSADLENTPRPLRNKRANAKMRSSFTITPPKRNKETPLHNRSKHGGFTAPVRFTQTPRALTQILEQNEPIDIYNISQSVQIIADALAKQEPDKSVDHIPPELISSSDPDTNEEGDDNALHQIVVNKPSHFVGLEEDDTSQEQPNKSSTQKTVPSELLSSSDADAEEVGDVNNFDEEIDVYKPSRLVGLVVDALSQRPPDKSVDHIPPELLSPTDQDADDDWLY